MQDEPLGAMANVSGLPEQLVDIWIVDIQAETSYYVCRSPFDCRCA